MRRRAGQALGAAAAVLAALCAAAPAAGAGGDADPTAPERLTLVSQSPWVAPAGTFELTVAVAGIEDGQTVTVSVRDRVPNRSQFLATLDGEGVRREITGGEATISGGEASFIVEGDALPREGAYPVVVELVEAGGEVADRLVTHLLRLDDPDPSAFPLGVALVVPVHAPPAHLAPGEVEADRLAPLGATVDGLTAHPDLAVTVVPTPETVDALAATDNTAAGALAGAIRGAQVIGGPWVRLDPGSWVAADLPTSAQDQAGAAALDAALGTPGDRSTWIAPHGVTGTSIAAAVDSGAEFVVVDGTDLDPVDADNFPVTLTRPFEIAVGTDGDTTVAALAADPTLAGHRDGLDDPVLAAHRMLADLAVLALDDPATQRVAVLRLDTSAAADGRFFEALLAGLEPPPAPPAPPAPEQPPADPSIPPESTTTTTTPPAPTAPAPMVVVQTLDAAFAVVTPAGADGGADADDPLVRSPVDEGPPPSLGSLPADIRDAEALLASYRTIFGPADAVGEVVEVVDLTAGSGDLDADERRGLLGRGAAALAAETDGITGPPNQRVTLTDRTGVVQLVLGNDTGRPADVTLRVRSDRIELSDDADGVVPVRLVEPTTRVDLHVRALTSGDAPLDLLLTSPDGRIALGASRITVRTTAVSGVGLVLMGAAAGFLLVWWTRTIVRERRTSRRPPAHARAHE